MRGETTVIVVLASKVSNVVAVNMETCGVFELIFGRDSMHNGMHDIVMIIPRNAYGCRCAKRKTFVIVIVVLICRY